MLRGRSATVSLGRRQRRVRGDAAPRRPPPPPCELLSTRSAFALVPRLSIYSSEHNQPHCLRSAWHLSLARAALTSTHARAHDHLTPTRKREHATRFPSSSPHSACQTSSDVLRSCAVLPWSAACMHLALVSVRRHAHASPHSRSVGDDTNVGYPHPQTPLPTLEERSPQV